MRNLLACFLVLLATVILASIAFGPGLTERESRFLASINCDIQQNPSNPELYLKRGKFYLGRCMTKEAISDYTKAIQVNPNPVPDRNLPVLGSPWQYRYHSYARRAETYALDGNDTAAQVDAQKAIAAGYPGGVNAVTALAEQARKHRAVGSCPKHDLSMY